MIEPKEEIIKKLVNKKNPYIRTSQLKAYGLNAYDINSLIFQERLIRIKWGLYKWKKSGKGTEYDEMLEVSAIVPNGVFCLFTAFSYHELSTHIPKEYNIAILRNTRKPKLPDYPPIKMIYLSNTRFNHGIIKINDIIRIYDLEKTVCDAVIYRNKIGIDVVKEVIYNYLKTPQRNLQKLMEYAESLRISKAVRTYLEVLV
jgi:predicted transcriptional regulator of viral defense system